MRLDFFPCPWVAAPASPLLNSCSKLLEGLWIDATNDFYAARLTRLAAGEKAPKGLQPFINKRLEERMHSEGWLGSAGRFRKDATWVRFSFRHQMSVGSDFLDALRMVRREGIEEVLLAAAPKPFLDVISPNDSGGLTSFEKYQVEAASLVGVFDFPLYLGCLNPLSSLRTEVARVVYGDRPRDEYVPAKGG